MVRSLDPQKKEKFLQAALELFAAEGVQHTSTADIARRAGAAAGTLFIYFPTRQQLLDELILDISRRQSQAVRPAVEASRSARQAFRAIWDGSLRWFLEHPAAFACVQQVREPGLISEAAVQESARCLEYYGHAVRLGLEEGSLQPYPPEVIGTFLYQDLVAAMNLARLQPDPARQDEILRLGFEIFWNGVRRPEGPP